MARLNQIKGVLSQSMECDVRIFLNTLPVFYWCNKDSSPVISLICIKFVFKRFIIAETLDNVTVLEDGVIIVQGGTHFVPISKKKNK